MKGTTKLIMEHLINGGIVFRSTDNLNAISWINSGRVYHMSFATIKPLFDKKILKNAYLNGYSHQIQLMS